MRLFALQLTGIISFGVNKGEPMWLRWDIKWLVCTTLGIRVSQTIAMDIR